MSFLNFSEANCKNCYKCLRSCSVQAIKIENEQACIVEERCIGCGQCFVVCPQDARNIKSDLDEVKRAIAKGKNVIASLAPSFVGTMNMDEAGQMVTGLKKLGFIKVEETAIGAEIVADLYDSYVKQKPVKNIITTCCPSANALVETYFPQLVPYLIPVVSPMLAHGKMLKAEYGRDSYVVFIGPCIAKKIEATDFQHEGTIDAVLTFEELSKWLEQEKIVLNQLYASSFDQQSYKRGRAFPLGGGVIDSFGNGPEKNPYESIKVAGLEECIEIFKSMEAGHIENVCVEVNVCKGSCLNGPGMPKCKDDFYKRQKKLKAYLKDHINTTVEGCHVTSSTLNLTKRFFERPVEKIQFTDIEIQDVLKKIGKHEKSDELNCGGCGYNTCREKAQAVLEGMAELNMCLPFMRSKAERLTNIIFENSPNAIIMVDEEMNVREMNPTAEKIFQTKAKDIVDKPVSIIMDDSKFQEVKNSRKSITGHKVVKPEYDAVLLQNITYLEKQNIILGIMTDITLEEKDRTELRIVRERSINAAQKVIEKQMRVAQEIASLLGETTAETKVTLTRLKEMAIGESGEI